MIRVLQLDRDQEFRSEVAAYFGRLNDLQYRGLDSEAELEAVLNGGKPDVILLDMGLEPESSLAVLARIRARWKMVKLIMVSRTPPGEQILAQAAEYGADYFLLRPVDLVVLEKRIRQLLNPAASAYRGEFTRRQVQDVCTSYFERMGVPPHYKGYRYLVEAIWLAALHPDWLSSVTQNLYPAVGQRFGVSAAQVERDMRYALEVTWEKGDMDQLYQVFPFIPEDKGKPTNSAFISKMVDLVGLELQARG